MSVEEMLVELARMHDPDKQEETYNQGQLYIQAFKLLDGMCEKVTGERNETGRQASYQVSRSVHPSSNAVVYSCTIQLSGTQEERQHSLGVLHTNYGVSLPLAVLDCVGNGVVMRQLSEWQVL